MRVALLAAVLALGLTACVPGSEPLQNGRLPDSALTTVTPTCRVVNEVADPLTQLLQTAEADHVRLRPETSSHTRRPSPGTGSTGDARDGGQASTASFRVTKRHVPPSRRNVSS